MAQECSRKVLVCIDGSDQAECAFDWYLQNMNQPNDYVYGIIVPEYHLKGVSVISMVGPLSDPDALTNEFKQQHAIVEKICADYTAKLRSKNCKGQIDSLCGGKPGETICEFAETHNVSSVVMGTRGLSKLKKMIMGSVSTYVMNHSNCPVTVVPLTNKKE